MQFSRSRHAGAAGAVIHEAKLHLRLVMTIQTTNDMRHQRIKSSAESCDRQGDGIHHRRSGGMDSQYAVTKAFPWGGRSLAGHDTQSIDKSPGFKTWTITSMVEEWMAVLQRIAGRSRTPTSAAATLSLLRETEHADPNFRPFLAIRYRPPSTRPHRTSL